MILEHALLHIRPGQGDAFAAAMREARSLVSCQPGFQGIDVRPLLGEGTQYLLLISWDDVGSHRDGFRRSEEYQQWRDLLHRFYDPMPQVNYFGASIFDD